MRFEIALYLRFFQIPILYETASAFLTLFFSKNSFVHLLKAKVLVCQRLQQRLTHGLRTTNEGINQRNLKIWANVGDKQSSANYT